LTRALTLLHVKLHPRFSRISILSEDLDFAREILLHDEGTPSAAQPLAIVAKHLVADQFNSILDHGAKGTPLARGFELRDRKRKHIFDEQVACHIHLPPSGSEVCWVEVKANSTRDAGSHPHCSLVKGIRSSLVVFALREKIPQYYDLCESIPILFNNFIAKISFFDLNWESCNNCMKATVVTASYSPGVVCRRSALGINASCHTG
jgi:hypothetical protein